MKKLVIEEMSHHYDLCFVVVASFVFPDYHIMGKVVVEFSFIFKNKLSK
ncbi:MAG: hypothetical protein ACI4F4_03290 [Lachnospiraceae bacterium]